MARGGGCPDQDANDDVRVYLNCAGMALFVLSAITLVGAYGPYSWISPEDIQGVGGTTGLMFVAPLAAALVVSGLQITSNRAGRNIPTAAEMTLFCALHLVAFLAFYMAIAFFQPVIDSVAVLMIGTACTIVLPAACFIQFRRKHRRL